MTRQRWWMLAGLAVVVALIAAAMALPESGVDVETAVLTRGTITVAGRGSGIGSSSRRRSAAG